MKFLLIVWARVFFPFPPISYCQILLFFPLKDVGYPESMRLLSSKSQYFPSTR